MELRLNITILLQSLPCQHKKPVSAFKGYPCLWASPMFKTSKDKEYQCLLFVSAINCHCNQTSNHQFDGQENI
jgi:hypothetical protein